VRVEPAPSRSRVQLHVLYRCTTSATGSLFGSVRLRSGRQNNAKSAVHHVRVIIVKRVKFVSLTVNYQQ